MYKQITSNKRKTLLLIIIFIAIIALIGYSFQVAGIGSNTLYLAILISLLMSLGSYFAGDKIALTASGAKGPITQQKNSYVYRMVENLCITAGLQRPKIYIIPDNSINAFATGRDPEHASIAITQGAIDKLKNEELEGVIAHELSHIKNYDIRLMMMVVVLVGTVALASRWFWYGRMFGGKRDNQSSGGGQILMILGVILLILSPIIAQLIKLAISRKREFLADASASLLTRYPEGLAQALEKISQENKPLKKANNALAHLYISNPFGSRALKGTAKLFSTHPPVEERIKKLRTMS